MNVRLLPQTSIFTTRTKWHRNPLNWKRKVLLFNSLDWRLSNKDLCIYLYKYARKLHIVSLTALSEAREPITSSRSKMARWTSIGISRRWRIQAGAFSNASCTERFNHRRSRTPRQDNTLDFATRTSVRTCLDSSPSGTAFFSNPWRVSLQLSLGCCRFC